MCRRGAYRCVTPPERARARASTQGPQTEAATDSPLPPFAAFRRPAPPAVASRSGDRRNLRTVLRVDHDAERIGDQALRRGTGMNAIERERAAEWPADGHRVARVTLREVRERPDLVGVGRERAELGVDV